MEWLASFGWWKVVVIVALFAVMFLARALAPNRPNVPSARERRRRRYPPGG